MCHKSLQLFTMIWILNNSFNLSINVLCDFMMRSFTNSELIIPVFYTSMVITDDKITFSLFVYIMSPTERPNKVRITSSMYPTSNHFNILFGTRIFNYMSATNPRKTYKKLNWNADERETARKSTTSAPLAVSARSSATFIIREELLSDIHVLPQYTVIGGALFICWDGLCALRMRGNMRG